MKIEKKYVHQIKMFKVIFVIVRCTAICLMIFTTCSMRQLTIRVILKMEIPQIGLPTLLVVPMGTLRYHTKNGAHSMHPRVAIGGPIFTTMAM